ncbi:MAG: exodeoxyribonuclease VII small subunit [Phycisphaerales bacterium]
MSTKKTKPAEKLDGLTYEQALQRVEAIADRIESGEIGIEDAVSEYEQAMKLIRHCRGILDTAEQKITELTPDSSAEDADE